MPQELDHPTIVDFPLRGEGWVAVTSPASRIPSHGTDLVGQRYAYDFLRWAARPGARFHRAGMLRTLIFGVPTRECYAWGATVHAPFDGEVMAASDGMVEREWLHPARESIRAIRTALTFSPERVGEVLGNHVVLRSGEAFAAFAHLAPGSVVVAAGERVTSGALLGRVGHTGNSTSPHLHFQLMDSLDPTVARGIPCAFERYEVERDGRWELVLGGIPSGRERIRSVDREQKAG